MTTDAEHRSTWPRNGQTIRRAELLRLIEENGGPQGLDLRGTLFLGEGQDADPEHNPIELSPEALTSLATAYRQANGGRDPPWVGSRGGVSLRQAQLQGANLSAAQLQRADLHFAELQGAVLQRAQLEWAVGFNAQLQGADLFAAGLQWALLSGARLQGASLSSANLEGAFLSHAQLQGADLWGAQLQGADLSRAQLQLTHLSDAQLQGAELWRAQLEGADLSGAWLDRVDVYDVDSLDGAHWYGAHLDHTRIKRESLGKAIGDELLPHKKKSPEWYHRAKEAYLLLKNNFNQIGRYEDASWAYVKEQQMERMAYYREWRSHGWRLWRGWGPLGRWLRNWAYELLTGYGERPWNAVAAGGLIVFLLAVVYWLAGALSGRARPGLFTSWNPADIDWVGFLDGMIYSLATFATFNLARPAINPEGRVWEAVSSVEAILGISVLALVVFTVGNRMSRG